MNARVLKLGVLAAIVLALSACAGHPYREEQPHHYSKDRDGNRIACYATEVANEYDCVPVVRRQAYAYDPYWDPFWPGFSLGFYYGWPRYYNYGPYWYPYRYPHRPWHGPVRPRPGR
jgi:hypothetical protein